MYYGLPVLNNHSIKRVFPLSSKPDVPPASTWRPRTEPELTEVGRGQRYWRLAPAGPRPPVRTANSQPLYRPAGVCSCVFALFLSVSSLRHVLSYLRCAILLFLLQLFLLWLSLRCTSVPFLLLQVNGGGVRSATDRVQCVAPFTGYRKHWVSHRACVCVKCETCLLWFSDINYLQTLPKFTLYKQPFINLHQSPMHG